MTNESIYSRCRDNWQCPFSDKFLEALHNNIGGDSFEEFKERYSNEIKRTLMDHMEMKYRNCASYQDELEFTYSIDPDTGFHRLEVYEVENDYLFLEDEFISYRKLKNKLKRFGIKTSILKRV